MLNIFCLNVRNGIFLKLAIINLKYISLHLVRFLKSTTYYSSVMDFYSNKVFQFQESEQIPQGAIDFKEFTDTECDIEKVTNYDMNDVALLPYSSGTTGLPKGVELTQKNIVASLMQNNEPFFRLAVETSGKIFFKLYIF